MVEKPLQDAAVDLCQRQVRATQPGDEVATGIPDVTHCRFLVALGRQGARKCFHEPAARDDRGGHGSLPGLEQVSEDPVRVPWGRRVPLAAELGRAVAVVAQEAVNAADVEGPNVRFVDRHPGDEVAGCAGQLAEEAGRTALIVHMRLVGRQDPVELRLDDPG